MNLINADQVSGKLGRFNRRYSKTLRIRKDSPAWREVIIRVWGDSDGLLYISFDGKNYSDPIIVKEGKETVFQVAARAIRIRSPKGTERMDYWMCGRS